jgi:autophagy-related protein 9
VIFMAFYGWQVVRFGLGFSRLVSMSHFYSELLNIPDADVQSIPWHEVVTRLSHLRQTYPNTSISSSRSGNRPTESKMDAHDVANRIMRQENYLVALFNKDVLDLRLPFPGFQSRPPELTKTLEWNLSFCLLGFLFDSKGQVRRQFLTDRHRKDLIEG